MVGIPKRCFALTRARIKQLSEKGIKIPESAYSYEYNFAPKMSSYTEIYTFTDQQQRRLFQLKQEVDRATKKTAVQTREYEYIHSWASKGKISQINQKKIGFDGKETDTVWRFYHPKDDSPMRFSQKREGVERNNYLHSDGYIVDNNGLKIRPISTAEYIDKKKDLDSQHFVDAPWTLKQSITTKDRCGTDSVQECTVVGIYGDKGISLNHLNPNNRENECFARIEFDLMEQLEQQGENAKAFIIGACEDDSRSNRQFNNIVDLFTDERVKFSQFKTGDKVLYDKFSFLTQIKGGSAKKLKEGNASVYEWQSGQHLIYENGELQIANVVIDDELKKGNTDPESLIKQSFSRIRRG